MHAARNAARKNAVAAATNATRSAALTSITFVRCRAVSICRAASTNAIRHATRVAVCRAIVAVSMNYIASVALASSIHQCRVAQRSRPAKNPVHAHTTVTIRCRTIVIRHQRVHRAWRSPRNSVTAATSNAKLFPAVRRISVVDCRAVSHCHVASTNASRPAMPVHARSTAIFANRTAPSRASCARIIAMHRVIWSVTVRTRRVAKMLRCCANVASASKHAPATISHPIIEKLRQPSLRLACRTYRAVAPSNCAMFSVPSN